MFFLSDNPVAVHFFIRAIPDIKNCTLYGRCQMCVYPNQHSVPWMLTSNLLNSLTRIAGDSVITEDVLKEIVVAAHAQLVAGITGRSERQKSINCSIVQTRGSAYGTADAVLKMLPIGISVVIPIVTPHH